MTRSQKIIFAGNNRHTYEQFCLVTFIVSGYFGIWPYLGGSKFRDFSSKLSIWARKISCSNCVRVASFYIGISALYVTRNGRENARRDRRKKEMRYTGLMSIFSGQNSGLNHTFFTKRPPPGTNQKDHQHCLKVCVHQIKKQNSIWVKQWKIAFFETITSIYHNVVLFKR